MSKPCVALEQLRAAVDARLDGDRVIEIAPRGRWLRALYTLRLASGREAVLKVENAGSDAGMCAKEDYVASMLRANGLPAPATLALDGDGTAVGAPFIVQQRAGGRPLNELMRRAGRAGQWAIYRSLGGHYRRLHSISGQRSGWIVGAGNVLPVSPGRFQHEKVVLVIGQQAVAAGHISQATQRQLARLMELSLDYLDEHRPVLVGGTLPWTIHLDRHHAVAKLTDLHDYLWWDAAHDLAALRYPAFMDIDEGCWSAFMEAYADRVDDRRMRLYRLIQAIDALMGNYLEPPWPGNERWRARTRRELASWVEAAARAHV